MESQNDPKETIKQAPEVRFSFDPEAEVTRLNDFLSRKVRRAGVNLTESLLEAHPALRGLETLAPDDRLTRLRLNVHDFYARNAEQLKKAADTIKREWDEYAPEFFEAARRIFNSIAWPRGEYKGYLSMSPPFPRHLDSKTFHLPYDSIKRAIRVTAHEMLHFLFYEYVRQRYTPDLVNISEKEMSVRLSGKFIIPLWELSEIFDIAVLSGDEFGEGAVKQSANSYTHLAIYASKFNTVWKDSKKDINELFTKLEAKSH